LKIEKKQSLRIITERLIKNKARFSFSFFVNEIFSKSFDNFIDGEYINSVCDFLQESTRSVRIAPRDHFKSTSLYAHFMWQIWKARYIPQNIEGHYFSYQSGMSSYHIQKIKEMIRNNPYFDDLTDLKEISESTCKYTWDGIHYITLEPHGLLAFKRGIHCDLVYIDDPFQDPENKMLLTNIYKINKIFVSNIMDMPKKGGGLHCCGTPQTTTDFFFDKKVTKRFNTKFQPAIVSDKQKIALWPEHLNYKELKLRQEERGLNLFSQEYLCMPVYSSESFINLDRLNETVNKDLPNSRITDTIKHVDKVFGGWDLGKKVHPSHFAVFKKDGDKAIMIHHKFMDNWDYSNGTEYDPDNQTQIEYIKLAIKQWGINTVYYDSTRGELESFAEQNLLPPALEPVIFNTNTKMSMATKLDSMVTQKRIELIDDNRLLNQIVAVTNDLKAIESPEGHGDSFWSVALCMFGHWDTGNSASLSTGGRSVMDSDTIPEGF